MKVIGAGLPRTATLTQKIALEMLGYGPCYHMVNVLSDLTLAPRWAAAFDGSADWDAIFAGHESTVDWPGSFHWRAHRRLPGRQGDPKHPRRRQLGDQH